LRNSSTGGCIGDWPRGRGRGAGQRGAGQGPCVRGPCVRRALLPAFLLHLRPLLAIAAHVGSRRLPFPRTSASGYAAPCFLLSPSLSALASSSRSLAPTLDAPAMITDSVQRELCAPPKVRADHASPVASAASTAPACDVYPCALMGIPVPARTHIRHRRRTGPA
jgi:hypothetical protein